MSESSTGNPNPPEIIVNSKYFLKNLSSFLDVEFLTGDDHFEGTHGQQTLSFPVTDKDDDIVECSLCNEKSTFRQFRIHNLTAHYNLATTAEDTVTKDFRFFTRQLTDMAKIMKISTFNCPNENCFSRYKSALGLGYHLEQCGKTNEEIRSSYVTCEICDRQFSNANIYGHRKTHSKPAEEPAAEVREPPSKRASAQRAQKFLKSMSTRKEESEDAEASAPEADDDKDKNEEFILSEIRHVHSPSSADGSLSEDEVNVAPPPSHEDITYHAYKSLSHSTHFMDVWDKPVRSSNNIFSDIPLNPVKPLSDPRSYLPDFQMSFTFRTKTSIPDETSKGNLNVVHSFNTGEYHRLRIFDSEVADSNIIVNAGGPISAMTWHPSGKYIAVAALKNHSELPQVHNLEINRTCIQLYENQISINVLKLQIRNSQIL
ncbi:unnamed protein product [Allacma fusca]|uniref:Uncharacterized protein n=1 Tax=Allacma fusca TaxID=39272 RepID=A0A8J2KTW3_9HEXA|nr:unnamed protein product [Allacma fusca]